ncbi:hypothetical protein BDZ88DRAFT_87309 [Geranomyces variabilis]|nr:hypothetical protein BDZ88DRAFT_87309 [Geranomyces variabilis]KAJ3137542.1 hypothetical protein HDU90_001945 [Geranomyces variabilis]
MNCPATATATAFAFAADSQLRPPSVMRLENIIHPSSAESNGHPSRSCASSARREMLSAFASFRAFRAAATAPSVEPTQDTYPPPTYPLPIPTPPTPTCTPTVAVYQTTPVLPSQPPIPLATPAAAAADSQPQPDQQQQPKDKIKRRRATPAQQQALFAVLKQTHFPSTELRGRLAKDLDMTPRAVQIWFQNRRQAARIKQTKGEAAAADAAGAATAGGRAGGGGGRLIRALSPPVSNAGDEDQDDNDNGSLPGVPAAAAAAGITGDTPLMRENCRPVKLAVNSAAFAPLLTPISPDGDGLTRADYFHTVDSTVRRPSAESNHHHYENRHQHQHSSQLKNQHHHITQPQRPQQLQLPRFQTLAGLSSSHSIPAGVAPPTPPRLPRARTTAIDIAAAALPDRLRDLPFWTLPAPFAPRAAATGSTTPSA